MSNGFSGMFGCSMIGSSEGRAASINLMLVVIPKAVICPESTGSQPAELDTAI
jgi:hypothetical protein